MTPIFSSGSRSITTLFYGKGKKYRSESLKVCEQGPDNWSGLFYTYVHRFTLLFFTRQVFRFK